MFIKGDSGLVKRHRNPVGIFSRALIYPLAGVAVWQHRRGLLASAVLSEAVLWCAVPPVEETFGFIEDAIEVELGWLNAPSGREKRASLAVLALFPPTVFAGLWRHSPRLLASGATLILCFYMLMRHLAGKPG